MSRLNLFRLIESSETTGNLTMYTTWNGIGAPASAIRSKKFKHVAAANEVVRTISCATHTREDPTSARDRANNAWGDLEGNHLSEFGARHPLPTWNMRHVRSTKNVWKVPAVWEGAMSLGSLSSRRRPEPWTSRHEWNRTS